jgi:hypothetical protein
VDNNLQKKDILKKLLNRLNGHVMDNFTQLRIIAPFSKKIFEK